MLPFRSLNKHGWVSAGHEEPLLQWESNWRVANQKCVADLFTGYKLNKEKKNCFN